MKTKTKANKTGASGNVIRTILRQELQNLESKIDQRFVSFESKIDQRFVSFEKKVNQRFVLSDATTDFKLSNLERKIDEKAKQYRDQILTSNDKLMKELETHREERTIGDFQTKEKLADYGKRIKILELA